MTVHVQHPLGPVMGHAASPVKKARTLASDSSMAARLRLETRAEHVAIETNPRMKRLLAPDLTRPEYAGLLLRQLGFYHPVERALAAWTPDFPQALDLPARLSKTLLLRIDLAALGCSETTMEDEPRAPHDDFATLEQAWGWLYVLEGSTLGGQLIARDLKAGIGVTAEQGASFYDPYGPSTGARWQSFKACLNQEVEARKLDAECIVMGARQAFAALDVWMAG